MASSEEDGANGGAPEAGDEKEATGRRRRLGFLATAWLTFYNIAMTAGYVRPAGPACRAAPDSGLGQGRAGPGVCGVEARGSGVRGVGARAVGARAGARGKGGRRG